MADIKISQLNVASQLQDADNIELSQNINGTMTSTKTSIGALTEKVTSGVANSIAPVEISPSGNNYAVGDYLMYGGQLYKVISAITSGQTLVVGTNITAVTVTDEMGSGSGGGTGGHTIIDENGNSMTARSGLQFFGAVEVRDDIANNRTLVEVLGGDFYNPVIYSTEEREIGVWTDGKPLYEKTIDLGALPNNTTKAVNHNISNIDKIVFLNGIGIRTTDNDTVPIPYVHRSSLNNQIQMWANDTSVSVGSASDASNRNGYAVIRYTKTSDTAGSGSWTPQGVPAVHYSTDEQVIGTWVDGKTIYEKTIDFGSLPNNDTKSVAHNISNIDLIISITGRAKRSDGTTFIPMPDVDNTSILRLWANTTNINVKTTNDRSNYTKSYVTIQYTKSS